MLSGKLFNTEDIKRYMVLDKGLFSGGLEWSDDSETWQQDTLQINSIGQLTISYQQLSHYPIVENSALKLNNHNIYNLHDPSNLKSGNSISNNNAGDLFKKIKGYRDVLIKNLHSSSVSFNSSNGAPVIQVVSVNEEKCYFRTINNEKTQFVRFLASLMVWQNMNIYGIHNKYFNIPLPFSNLNNCHGNSKGDGGKNQINISSVSQSIQINDEDNEDNVIIINKEEKNLLVCRFKIYGPIPKNQRKNLEVPGPKNPLYALNAKDVSEGWFYSMGVIKSNGILDLLSEYDGTLLYSIDISSLIRSEICQVHHSIFENSNVLYIGVINELRQSNINPNICPTHQRPNFFIPSPVVKFNELRNFPNQRILIDFPLHIDLEDWYVALKSLAAREYVGINSQYSTKSSLRISKKLHVDILEANFEEPILNSGDEDVAYNDYGELIKKGAKLYTDILFWGSTWARTSIVESSRYPFWREEFDFELPILTNSFQIVVKKCASLRTLNNGKRSKKNSSSSNDSANGKCYSDKDAVLGIVSITEELIENSDNKETWIPLYALDTAEQIGQICLRLSLKEWHILPPSNFDVLQKMLLNTSLSDLIQFLGSNDLISKYEDLEEISNMMLDIFQALHREELWFGELIDYDLKKVGMMLRGNRQSAVSPASNTGELSTNFFNTLFRGNSILTKTFEKYNLRVGQEFLEKVVGEFVLQVAEDNFECEIDPARIRANDNEDKEFILDDNFMRLFEYVENIWSKIYNSCNDLPYPIKKELEIFRNKIEAACDPSDPKTSSLALNCITGFLFLRLICPAILNPKLFFLIKDHQTGNIKRTLTLVSKIILTLSNRTRFGAKEPWLIKMNYFLEQHESELLDYLDIITNRKNDPRPKILDLSDTVVRPDITISPQISAELPTNPFLIDKYLRLTQLANILAAELINHQDEFVFENNPAVAGNLSARLSTIMGGKGSTSTGTSTGSTRNSFRNSYKIGSLVFEEQVMKNNNLAFASEELLRNLSQLGNSSNRISTSLAQHSQVSLGDIKQESYLLLKKVSGLDHLLTSFENPSLIYANWGKFVNMVIESSIVDHRKRLLYFDNPVGIAENPNFRKLNDDGITFLKFKFNNKATAVNIDGANVTDHLSVTNEMYSVSLSNESPKNHKNNNVNGGDAYDGNHGGSILMGGPPKLSRLIKSASSNTLISSPVNRTSFDDSLRDGSNDGSRSPFRKTFFWRKKN